LYAQWTLNNYKVTYIENGSSGGSVPTDNTNYHILNTVIVNGNTGLLVKTGYTFVGWNTESDGSGTTYTEGATIIMGSGNISLYAKWVANDYTITYNGNGNSGGKVPTDSKVYHISNIAKILGNTGSLTKNDYTFKGWNTAADGSGTSYKSGDSLTIGSENIILYAQWKKVASETTNSNNSTSSSQSTSETSSNATTTSSATTGTTSTNTSTVSNGQNGTNSQPDQNNETQLEENAGEGNDNTNAGDRSVTVEASENIPSVSIASNEELYDAVLSEEDEAAAASGAKIKIKVVVEEVEAPEDAELIQQNLGENIFGIYLDISIFKSIDDNETEVHELKKPITITFDIPEEFKGHSQYYIIRGHNGETTLLMDEDDNPDTITISSDKFSTYALVYSENKAGNETVNTVVTAEVKNDKKVILVGIILCALIAGVVVFVFSKKRKENQKHS